MELLTRNCPSCGSDEYSLLKKENDKWNLCECDSCGFVYLQNPPTYEALSELYCWDKQFKTESQKRRKKRPLIRRLSENTRWRTKLLFKKDMQVLIEKYAKPGKIVDIGCGVGDRLLKLNKGYIPYGIEISLKLSKEADEKLSLKGGKCIHDNALDGLKKVPQAYFSGATLRSYLEHEYNPKDVLRALYSSLQNDGIAIIKVPNYNCINRNVMKYNWCGYRYPDHVNYFTPNSLKKLVHEAGFKIKRFSFFDRLPFSDNMWLVAQK